MIVVGDIHGEYDSLMRLCDKLPHDNLCFVGDLEDRGPNSKEVIEFVKNNDYPCVLGNHELMMIESAHGTTDVVNHENYKIWERNGGLKTVESYYNNGIFDTDLFLEHKEWMKELPLYIWVDKNKIISHTRYLPFLNKDIENKDIVWYRHRGEDHNIKNVVNIHGHLIIFNVEIKYNYLNIDTGCYSHGILTAYDTETNLVHQYNKERNMVESFNIYD